jgi:hypothetical protein
MSEQTPAAETTEVPTKKPTTSVLTRVREITVFAIAVVGLTSMIYDTQLQDRKLAPLWMVGSLLVALGAPLFTFVARFLTTRSRVVDEDEGSGDMPMSDRLKSLEDSVTMLQFAPPAGQAIDVEELVEALMPNLPKEVSDELMRRAGENTSRKRRDDQIRISFQRSRTRMERELETLERRATVNLSIGVTTTTIAIAVMALLAFMVPTSLDTPMASVNYYIPKLSLLIFIEVFAFFFLRMYRATLAELRLYQKDLNGLAVRQVATLAALDSGSETCVLSLTKDLFESIRPAVKAKEVNGGIDAKTALEMVQSVVKAAGGTAKEKPSTPSSGD